VQLKKEAPHKFSAGTGATTTITAADVQRVRAVIQHVLNCKCCREAVAKKESQ
jgi:hypothetical protein